MTEYEIQDLLNSSINTFVFLFTSYVSIVFAFLVAATLASDRLNRVLVGIAVALYTMTSIFFLLQTGIAGMTALGFLARSRGIDSPALSLTAFPVLMVLLVVIIMALTYIGSLVFFFYQRKTRKKQEAPGS